MAETSGPFDPADPENPEPSEILTQSNWGLMLENIIDGVLSENDLVASASGAAVRGVDISAGTALCAGHWYNNSATLTVTSTANASGADRIDRAVLRLDRVEKKVTVTVIEGTPGHPAPALTLTDSIQDRTLWRWTVAPGATTVSNLIDERHFRVLPLHVCAQDPVPRLRYPGMLWTNKTTGRLMYTPDGQAAYALGPRVVQTSNVPLASGWQADAPCTVTVVDGVAYLTINAKWTGSTRSFANTQGMRLGMLPAGFRPSVRRGHTTHASLNVTFQLHIQSDGRLEIWHPTRGIQNGSVIRETIVFNL